MSKCQKNSVRIEHKLDFVVQQKQNEAREDRKLSTGQYGLKCGIKGTTEFYSR